METNTMTNVGFHSIHLAASQDITIKKGMSIKCNASFIVNDGILYIDSDYSGITIVLPQINFEAVEIESEYGSVKCDGVNCKQLSISSAHDVKIDNSHIDECEISSEYDSIHIINSRINNANLSAAHNVSVELDEFSCIEIVSQYDGVKFIYNGTQQVNADCTSEYGTVKARGVFYGGADCNKRIIITAAHDIRLFSRNK